MPNAPQINRIYEKVKDSREVCLNQKDSEVLKSILSELIGRKQTRRQIQISDCSKKSLQKKPSFFNDIQEEIERPARSNARRHKTRQPSRHPSICEKKLYSDYGFQKLNSQKFQEFPTNELQPEPSQYNEYYNQHQQTLNCIDEEEWLCDDTVEKLRHKVSILKSELILKNEIIRQNQIKIYSLQQFKEDCQIMNRLGPMQW